MDARTMYAKWMAAADRLKANRPEDREWRERVLTALSAYCVKYPVPITGATMSNDLVPTPEPDETPALIPDDPFAGTRQIAVYLDIDTPERAAQLGRAVNANGSNADQYLGKCYSCVGLTVYSRQVSPDGEEPVRQGTYLALHLDDGRNIVMAGGTVLQPLPLLREAYGLPPWPVPVPITFTTQKTSSGRRRYVLAPGDITGKEL